MEAYTREKRYTYADWANWPDDERWELIGGVPHLMAPPLTDHESVSGELYLQIGSFLRDKPCRVFHAGFGVRLNPDGADDTILLPDLTVVCDPSRLSKYGCEGAPDMVAEILSPSTSARDKIYKFDCYLKSGVKEYWIVDPKDQTVSVHLLNNGQYVIHVYGEGGRAPVSVLPGCEIDLQELFKYNTLEE